MMMVKNSSMVCFLYVLANDMNILAETKKLIEKNERLDRQIRILQIISIFISGVSIGISVCVLVFK